MSEAIEQSTDHEGFEPKILGFCCNWCSYAGADLAGVSRLQYPPNLRVIRVMCSGRVDSKFVLEGFLNGADGVMVLGCHPGDCHYLSGNYEAMNTMNMTSRLLRYVGINPERLLLDWVSAAEGARFARIVSEFTDLIRELGPLGQAEGLPPEELRFRLRAAKAAVEHEKLRWVVGKQTEFATEGNRYGEVFTRHEMNRLLDGVIMDEVIIHQILQLLRERPMSVREISDRLSLPPNRVLNYIAALLRREFVELSEIRGTSPLYAYKAEETESGG